MKKTIPSVLFCLISISSICLADTTSHLIIEMKSVKEKPKSTIICALFNSADGFPMNSSKAIQTKDAIQKKDIAICEFDVPSDNFYAVSIGHDENGNRKVDTNLFGIPTEGWGTSNNVTHSFRAPNFEESKVLIKESTQKVDVVIHY